MTGLKVRGLSKSFGGLQVAQDIDFDLQPGARKALIGPNGAGKSTFGNLVTGILRPTAGTIELNGRNIAHDNEAQRVRLGIAKTFQITTLFRHLTARENMLLPIIEREKRGAQFWGRSSRAEYADEAQERLTQFGLEDLADRRVDDLAYGQQRLIEMALTLALKPSILILDEPAAGVPSGDSHLIIDAIERIPDHVAVLIIEHDMDLVFRIARSIVVLVQGKILTEGTPDEISRDQRVREMYLGGAHG